jgi:hypothetical protein
MKYKLLIIIAVFATAFLQGCDTEPDVAPMPTFLGKANTTIAELLAMHTIGSVDSYDSIPIGSNIIISGIVTTSDEWGNNYKTINIEDETGGIQIKINNTALYNKYHVGQRVYVKCDGLVLGDYRKLPQLGFWANGGMQPIPSFKTYLYIFPDGAPMAGPNPIVMTTIPRADAIPSTNYNRLVRLEGATFVEGGIANFSNLSSATSRDIKMQDGSTITMRTSNYAKFASETLPSGTGNITGILTRYNNTVQIVISGLGDLQDFVTPPTQQTIFSVNYNNAFNEGWTQSGTGNPWQVLINNNFSGFYVTPAANENFSLVSPSINLSNCSSPVFSFTHRATQGFVPDNMLCFYTNNYTGDVTTTTWTPLALTAASGQTSSSNETFALPDETLSSTDFRIMFVIKTAQSAWYLSDIKITGYTR